MYETVRTFIAIPVTATQQLIEFTSNLRGFGGPVRTVDVNQMHLTLSFLGETSQQQFGEIEAKINEVAQRHVAFDVEISGVDAFPDRERPRVLWAGFSPTERIAAIANDLRTSVEDLGFPRERRKYTPHLTLAYFRGRPPSAVQTLMSENRCTNFGTRKVEEIVFYQSELTRNGPLYTSLSSHHLLV